LPCTTTAGKYNIYQVQKGDAISILKDSFPGKFASIKIIPITEGDIKSTIHYLQQQKKSSCYDEITSKILKV
jgi:hypothetical protein